MNPQTNHTHNTAPVPVCPGCGGSLIRRDTAICPYCGMEIIDLSREHTDIKIEAVKKACAETSKIPKKAAFVVIVTLFTLFLSVIAGILFHLPEKIQNLNENARIERLSSAMEKAYKKEDWEQLGQYVITECEEYISAPDYFLYRTSWLLHTYPPLFDNACDSSDTDTMLDIYDIIAGDYDRRGDDFFYKFYETDEAIEQSLKEEFERETEILTQKGLEDEMYKLRF